MKPGLRRKLPTFIILFLILVVAGISVKLYIDEKNAPTTEKQNLYDYYLEDDNSAAIIVNGKLTSVRAILVNKQPYVTLGLVTGEINPHFYYESTSGNLLCTTADKVTTATKSTTYNDAAVFYDSGNSDKTAAKLDDEDRIYVQLSYVASYTEINVQYYSNPARVFIRSKFGAVTNANAAKGACLRTKADSKQGLILREFEEGEELWVISRDNGWNLVCSESLGLSGYVTDEELTSIRTDTEKCSYTTPTYEHTLMDETVCMAWHQTLSDSGLSAVSELLEDASELNVISPTWFSVVSSDGTIESRANGDYVAKAREQGLKVWALVENFNTSNTLDYGILLGTSSARNKMITFLIDEAIAYDLDGINVDFEGLPSTCGDSYIQFIRELSIACRQQGLVLSVDCYVPSAWTEHYHRDALAEAADYIIIMAYDEHYDGSDAGSTSSLSFIKSGIEDTIAEDVPTDRIIVGIPFYSRVWKGDGTSLTSSTINMNSMKEILDEAGSAATWDESCGQYYIAQEIDGIAQQIWIENYDSLHEKLNLIDNYDVAGISGWKLGMDNSDAWKAIYEYLN